MACWGLQPSGSSKTCKHDVGCNADGPNCIVQLLERIAQKKSKRNRCAISVSQ